jgi:hypothetical protein
MDKSRENIQQQAEKDASSRAAKRIKRDSQDPKELEEVDALNTETPLIHILSNETGEFIVSESDPEDSDEISHDDDDLEENSEEFGQERLDSIRGDARQLGLVGFLEKYIETTPLSTLNKSLGFHEVFAHPFL